ncbi:hypothetical protein [Corynebacterium flavescens]|uniref:hypothetical protein n=1 Tax=Corynebacterium flavescens TaxID=28028 RepID=UPI003FD38AEC
MTLVTTGVWVWRPWRWRRPRFPRVALGIVVSIAAIGAVAAIPDNAGSTAVAWQHGTTGVAQACAIMRLSLKPSPP